MAVPNQFVQGGRSKYEPPVDAPYVFQEFPAMRYHPDGRTKVVNSDAEVKALGDGWQTSPCVADTKSTNAATCANCTDLTIELADTTARFNSSWQKRQEEMDELQANYTQLQAAFTDLQAKYTQLQKKNQTQPAPPAVAPAVVETAAAGKPAK